MIPYRDRAVMQSFAVKSAQIPMTSSYLWQKVNLCVLCNYHLSIIKIFHYQTLQFLKKLQIIISNDYISSVWSYVFRNYEFFNTQVDGYIDVGGSFFVCFREMKFQINFLCENLCYSYFRRYFEPIAHVKATAPECISAKYIIYAVKPQ